MEVQASKSGVVLQTVKDMNQSLVDDGMVYSDKIGSANFFWSFPSKALQDKINAHEMLTLQLSKSREVSVDLQRRLEEQRASRNAPGREGKIAQLTSLQTQEKGLDTSLEQGKANDPVEVNKVLKVADENMNHANRWTDNIWAMKKFLTKKKGMSGKEADKLLKLSDDFDYVSKEDLKAKSTKGKGSKK